MLGHSNNCHPFSRDILLSVISASQLPAMEEIPSFKRSRSPDTTGSSSVNNSPQVAMQVGNETMSRPIAGSQRVSNSQYSNSIDIMPDPFNFSSSTLYPDASWGLPVTSNELGNMPIHHGMDTSENQTSTWLADELNDLSSGIYNSLVSSSSIN